MQLDCNGKILDLSRPQVMGVLNITPDSFSDGGDFFSPEKALQHALDMEAAGAAIIDVGGESTRPGAAEVSLQEELDRVIPVIEALQSSLAIPISIDTQKPDVMRAAVAAGAGLINDVNALRETGAVEVAAACAVPVCLMHMQGDPRTMQ
ncbi:Dihydropteroate synthase, partial [hydrothermal vent metagenome]